MPYTICHLSKLPGRHTQNPFLCEHTLLLSSCHGFLFLPVMPLFLLKSLSARIPTCGSYYRLTTQLPPCLAFLFFCKTKGNEAATCTKRFEYLFYHLVILDFLSTKFPGKRQISQSNTKWMQEPTGWMMIKARISPAGLFQWCLVKQAHPWIITRSNRKERW